ncbi:MAG: hypothetical protein GXO75_19740 [Calditrichaeota bacterium]|nr:hypothetical protein [Calditrichota bacterium]
MELSSIQKALREADIDGWLFYDFHNRDAIAARVLNMDTSRFASRRWFRRKVSRKNLFTGSSRGAAIICLVKSIFIWPGKSSMRC